MRKQIQTDRAPVPGGAYSQGVLWNGLLFTAGVGPVDPNTGEIVGSTIEEQTHQVLKNLGAILDAAGTDWLHVLKTTVHLAGLQEDFSGFNTVYATYFAPDHRPVRTTVGSTLNGILVEIDLVAGVSS